MSEIFFFDTYAFIEVIRGNINYEKFENALGVTTVFNLAELNYILKKEMSKEKADSYIDAYSIFLIETGLQDVKNAMDFKTKNREVSIPDAIGYTIAKRLGIKFLTGDQYFENLSGVEFVK